MIRRFIPLLVLFAALATAQNRKGAPAPKAAATRPSEGPQAGDVKVNPKDGQQYVWISPGTFRMGCSVGDTSCGAAESPAHQVTLTKGFWIGQTPVTVKAWTAYRTATGKPALLAADNNGLKLNEAAGGDTPAVAMTWSEARDYCSWEGMRLPTEAQWEYAARAGSTAERYGDVDDIAWSADNSGRQKIDSIAWSKEDPRNFETRLHENGNGPHAVGSKQPNPWKLSDMLGNVWQWTADWYGDKYYDQSESRDPAGPPSGDKRALRGGSWFNKPTAVRVSTRGWYDPEIRRSIVGFRCVGD